MKPCTMTLLIGAMLMLVLPHYGSAQTAGDAELGTWTVDEAKSEYNPAAPLPKSETRVVEATPNGIKMTVQIQRTNGTKVTLVSTYKKDGKPYALSGNPDIDTLEVTLVSRRETLYRELKAGKIEGLVDVVISRDGKTRTATAFQQRATGSVERIVQVSTRSRL